MKAVGYKTPGPIDREDALQDIILETPEAEGRELLVKINAVSVNPVDVKLRMGRPPEGSEWQVLFLGKVRIASLAAIAETSEPESQKQRDHEKRGVHQLQRRHEDQRQALEFAGRDVAVQTRPDQVFHSPMSQGEKEEVGEHLKPHANEEHLPGGTPRCHKSTVKRIVGHETGRVAEQERVAPNLSRVPRPSADSGAPAPRLSQ
jgi:hypothetical protein